MREYTGWKNMVVAFGKDADRIESRNDGTLVVETEDGMLKIYEKVETQLVLRKMYVQRNVLSISEAY